MSRQQIHKIRNIFTFCLNIIQFISCIILLITLFTAVINNPNIEVNWKLIRIYSILTIIILILLINICINKKLTFAISAILSLMAAIILVNFSNELLLHSVAFATLATINALSNFVFI